MNKTIIAILLAVTQFSCGGGGDGGSTSSNNGTGDTGVGNGSTITTPTTHLVTVTSSPNGSISSNEHRVSHGFSTYFTLTPDDGYYIASVTGCQGSLSGSSYSIFQVTNFCSISVNFALDADVQFPDQALELAIRRELGLTLEAPIRRKALAKLSSLT